MRNPLGYKFLKTFQQAEQIYSLTKSFCSAHLDPIKDKRLISHMNDSARSIKQNISEGHGRSSTRQNLEFLGFAMG
jgi:four helix bundle protein